MNESVKISKALSDPIRYKILLMLANSEEGCCPVSDKTQKRTGLCNCELVAELRIIQSRVSYHMKELVEAGLVIEEPRGKWRYYFLNTTTLSNYISRIKKDFAL